MFRDGFKNMDPGRNSLDCSNLTWLFCFSFWGHSFIPVSLNLKSGDNQGKAGYVSGESVKTPAVYESI
jgi:hypothetical protein